MFCVSFLLFSNFWCFIYIDIIELSTFHYLYNSHLRCKCPRFRQRWHHLRPWRHDSVAWPLPHLLQILIVCQNFDSVIDWSLTFVFVCFDYYSIRKLTKGNISAWFGHNYDQFYSTSITSTPTVVYIVIWNFTTKHPNYYYICTPLPYILLNFMNRNFKIVMLEFYTVCTF